MKVTIDLPLPTVQGIEFGKKLSLHQDREIVRLVKAATLGRIENILYKDEQSIIELPHGQTIINGQPVTLTKIQIRMLHFIMQHHGEWVSAENVYSTVARPPWGRQAPYTAIKRLRDKVSPYVESSKNKTYRFTGNGKMETGASS